MTLERRMELSRRLNLLMAHAEATTGAAPTFTVIADYVAKRGGSLSRSRWLYMLHGTRHQAVNPALLRLVAEFFEVAPEYLLDLNDQTIPTAVESKLSMIKSLQAQKIETFAARALMGLSPATLKKIQDALMEIDQ